MDDILRKREFKRDVLLILIGAILASIPTLISTYMQGEVQLKQIILDRKITALKDYSISYNKLVVDLLPKVGQLESRILYYFDTDMVKSKVDKNKLINIYAEFEEYLNLHQSWIADVNTQTLIINSLFGTNLRIRNIYYFDPAKNNMIQKPPSQITKEILDGIISFKKIIVEDVNNRQEIMKELSFLIK